MLADTLRETGGTAFGPACEKAGQGRLPYCCMLSLRPEGRCSVESVSAIMRRFGIENASVDSVSQTLRHFGSLLPDTLETDNDRIRLVVSDRRDIFQKHSHPGHC